MDYLDDGFHEQCLIRFIYSLLWFVCTLIAILNACYRPLNNCHTETLFLKGRVA